MKKTQVIYYSQSGNTEKLALAIGEALSCPVGKVDSPLEEKVELLFLGSSLYKFGIDKHVVQFIQGLSPEKVEKVAIFATSCGMETAYGLLKKLLEKQGISVMEENFYCRGKFLAMNKTRPNEDDVKKIQEFAKKLAEG
ncbi:MAG: flavodoxin family protein [Eubacteriales bacterium]